MTEIQHPVSTYAELEVAAEAVRASTSVSPRVAIVLGSGLGGLSAAADVEIRIPYRDIPNMPVSTAPGHAGTVLLGHLEGLPVAMLSGRAHLYEGYEADRVVFAVRLMKTLGADTLVITNAAGGVNSAFTPGVLMLISDQINLTGRNPLVGPSDPRIGTRFPDMSEAYDARLRALAGEAANEIGLPITQGIYAGLLGPTYETPAEIRMLRTLGADAVGMSTVLEVIAANHIGLRVLGISCITNMAAGMLPQKLTEEEVIETANRVSGEFATFVRRFLRLYASSAENSRQTDTDSPLEG